MRPSFLVQGTRSLLTPARLPARLSQRAFTTCTPLNIIKPFILSDPGIKEVQIIQWFVQPGARVAEFDKICEIASDKAVTEITSRYEGVIEKLHHEADDFVQVGQPLLDIDVEDEDAETDVVEKTAESVTATFITGENAGDSNLATAGADPQAKSSNQVASVLATPAVRGLLKQHDLRPEDLEGTGKDGRILKSDVESFLQQRNPTTDTVSPSAKSAEPEQPIGSSQMETTKPLSHIQSQMYKTMSRSLQIPHFLYTDEVDMTALSALRHKLNAANIPPSLKLTALPIICKALAIAIFDHDLLNARLEPGSPTTEPRIHLRSQINIGIAVDTPSGLLVPNIKNVTALSIDDIAIEIARLSEAGREGRLSPTDLKNGTITVSNIGSIGGMYVSPLIVEGQVAILGIGKEREVPGFDGEGNVVRKRTCALSWAADHRLLDGAYVARAAGKVKQLLEEPGMLLKGLR